jgi:hypothetical protein
MAEPPLSLSQVWMVAAFAVVMVAGAVYVSILWGQIARRAIRTGRLLARGAIYNRQTTPVRYWMVFSAGLLAVLISIVMAIATCWVAWWGFTNHDVSAVRYRERTRMESFSTFWGSSVAA